jgi:hypothetical protein
MKLNEIITLNEADQHILHGRSYIGQWSVEPIRHAGDRDDQRVGGRLSNAQWTDLVIRSTRWLDKKLSRGKIQNGMSFLFYSQKLEQGIVVAPNLATHQFRIITVLPQGHTRAKDGTVVAMLEGFNPNPVLVYV